MTYHSVLLMILRLLQDGTIKYFPDNPKGVGYNFALS